VAFTIWHLVAVFWFALIAVVLGYLSFPTTFRDMPALTRALTAVVSGMCMGAALAIAILGLI
jgi:hypothetical protein